MEYEQTKENLANLEHEQWSHWMRYMFSICEIAPSDDMIIPAKQIAIWSRQMCTEYKDLSEKEKDSDREWAAKALKTIEFKKLLKEENRLGYELGANYVLRMLLEENKITHDVFTKLTTSI